MNVEDDRQKTIRKHAHRLAAEGLFAALNQWDLDRYYPDPEDQDTLTDELLSIIRRHRRQGQ